MFDFLFKYTLHISTIIFISVEPLSIIWGKMLIQKYKT